MHQKCSNQLKIILKWRLIKSSTVYDVNIDYKGESRWKPQQLESESGIYDKEQKVFGNTFNLSAILPHYNVQNV